MMRVPRTFGDCLLGFVALLFTGALTVSLQSKNILAPKVLALSSGQCEASDECISGAYTSAGTLYTCSGPPLCHYVQQDNPPSKTNPTQVCCFSNGQFANCGLIDPTATPCVVGGDRVEAYVFEGSNAMARCTQILVKTNWKSCYEQNVSSAASSRSASSAPATRCGDNTVQTLNSAGVKEECDWGTGNSDTLPDKCRKNCTLPHCGDKVVDTGEECDNTMPGQVDDFSFTWGGTETCNSNCTQKVAENPLYMMFTVNPIQDSPLYMILPIDWQSIFFPFSSIAF